MAEGEGTVGAEPTVGIDGKCKQVGTGNKVMKFSEHFVHVFDRNWGGLNADRNSLHVKKTAGK